MLPGDSVKYVHTSVLEIQGRLNYRVYYNVTVDGKPSLSVCRLDSENATHTYKVCEVVVPCTVPRPMTAQRSLPMHLFIDNIGGVVGYTLKPRFSHWPVWYYIALLIGQDRSGQVR